MSDQDLVAELKAAAGEASVFTDMETRRLMSGDLHVSGALPAAVLRPKDPTTLAAAVACAASRGYAILPRGGGLSYTGGYAPPTARSITVDLGGLDRIIEISDSDMVITVEAGVTWRQIAAALRPRGLRLPFFGTFSGAGATVGGGLSHGALFFGSARYGSAAEVVLGLDIVLADGRILNTGQGSLAAGSKPFLRTFGPDLTGLFTHDGGAFGIKTAASLRLIRAPEHEDCLSFAFERLETAAAALSEIARCDLAEEVYVLDPASTGAIAANSREKLRTAFAVARNAGGPFGALKALTSLARGGTQFIPPGHFSLHMVAAGRSAAAVRDDTRRAAGIARAHGGLPVAPTIPRVARANLFQDLNAVLGPEGSRWAALNAKVAHSDAGELIAAFDAMITPHHPAMEKAGIWLTRLASALSNHAFSFEPVFHWRDSWQPLHSRAPEPGYLEKLSEPAANPAARELVDQLRSETVQLFRKFGAASNQIGRTYPYMEALSPNAADLLRRIKSFLDPDGMMNPGVIGLGQPKPITPAEN